MESVTISTDKDFEFVKYLVKLKVVNDKILRDIEIRREYEQLQKAGTHTSKDNRQRLADKYFLSLKTIETAIYKDKKNENTILVINLKPLRMTSINLK